MPNQQAQLRSIDTMHFSTSLWMRQAR